MTKRYFKFYVLLLFALCTSLLSAQQPGTIDTTFNTFNATLPGNGANDNINATVIQPDGKIVIGGYFTSYANHAYNRIARINPDGSIDTSFNVGQGVNSGSVNTIALQVDGKILIGGNFTAFNGVPTGNLARLNADGSLDTTFNIGTGADDWVYKIAVQANGRILVGGRFRSLNGQMRNGITRLNASGTPDATFNAGTGTTTSNSSVEDIAIQPDGKIIIVGGFSQYNGVTANRIARLETSGLLDTTFDTGTGIDQSGTLEAVALQSDGKVVIVGSFSTYNGVARKRIARINSNGSIDTTFNPGTGFDALVFSVCVLPSGKILVGGAFDNYNGQARSKIACLNSDGSLDTPFSTGGVGNYVLSFSIQTDGKIIFAGAFSGFGGSREAHIGRLNIDLTADTTFNIIGGANNMIHDSVIQPDGKIIIVGSFTTYNGVSRSRIARLHPDGSLDETLDPGLGTYSPNYSTVHAVLLQPDGKIIIGGNFTHFEGSWSGPLVRLNPDGTRDQTFLGSASNFVNDLAFQPDGKIIVAGDGLLKRLNADGSDDESFNGRRFSIHFAYDVNAVAVQPDGKIIVGGWFSIYDDLPRDNIMRINADGSIDRTFNVGVGTESGTGPWVNAIVIQPDGKVIIGGAFAKYNTQSRIKLARLNANGSLDESFVPANAINTSGRVDKLALQPNGKLLVAGDFTTNRTQSHLTLLNTDGSHDDTFQVGTGPDDYVTSILCQNDGKILVGGNFRSYNGTYRNSYIRLHADPTYCIPPAPVALTQVACEGSAVSGLLATGSAIKWYTELTGGTALPSDTMVSATTYYASQTVNGCESARTAVTVTLREPVMPTFPAFGEICAGETLAPLPTTSTNGFTGTWSPALNSTETTTYTFTPTAGQCVRTITLTIVVHQGTTPTFNAVGAICRGAVLAPLPTTSLNGITGTWSPALNNLATTTYTFTSFSGDCPSIATMTIVVNQTATPTFNAVEAICSGASLSALPTTSTNGIQGTWSPALNNTATTTYTFTPAAGQCAATATMIITVNQNTTPAFAPVSAICYGTTMTALPVTSTNGVHGSWSPALNNTATTTYTFTPADGQCASATTMTITVNQKPTPLFAPVAQVCSGSVIPALPTTSVNGIQGSWSPAINNTATTTYTFTPAAGICAETATMKIGVTSSTVPTFNPIAALCSGATAPVLPVTSTNGINGTWSPSTVSNLMTATYTFTPSSGQCAQAFSILVEVKEVNTGTALNGNVITAAQEDATYQWLNCTNGNTPIAGATGQSYTAIADGNYAVSITLNGCTKVSNCVIVSTLNINNPDSAQQLLLYPNPVSGLLYVKTSMSIQSVQLYDVYGKKLPVNSWANNSLDVSHLQNGVYFIQLFSDGRSQTMKFVKH